MIFATDVDYDEAAGTGRAAAVGFERWIDSQPLVERTRTHAPIAAYEPGSFYKRELPCLVPLLVDLAALHAIDVVVVDGYVDLGPEPGLGRRLADALGALGLAPAIVGVAKTSYASAPAVEVLRGGSARPLFITAHGLDVGDAARLIASMHGAHRVPTLLRRVDQLARAR
ncbi:endonuclease V [Myxococcota bacterium]|nr:endonuclease V [Myxococcota bacterium]